MSDRILYLCEKPSQSRTLAKLLGADKFEDGAYLNEDTIVTNAHGHLLSLAMPDKYIGEGKWKLDDLPILPIEWIWTVNEKNSPQFETIRHWLSKADHVVIASDPDDEGEVLARQLLSAHQFKGKVSRMWTSALNPDALSHSLKNLLPLSATDSYYRAGLMRRMLDWLYGMNLSRGYSVKFDRTVHIGRVKTRLLHELVKRDQEIDAFKSNTYHKVITSVGNSELEYMGNSARKLNIDEQVELMSLSDSTGMCVSDDFGVEQLLPPLPYTLSALLADAANMGISLANGYQSVQHLYELGAVSYPRTGCTSMPGHGKAGFATHSAIVITGELPTIASSDMALIYNLINQNVLANEAGAATVHRRLRQFEFGTHVFQLSEKWADSKKAGFIPLVANNSIPALEEYGALLNGRSSVAIREGEPVELREIWIEEHRTVQPEWYDEATLLTMMAKNNIGTEATRVEAINSLTRNKVAVSLTQMDDYEHELGLPNVIKPTQWGKWLHASLHPSVTSQHMVDHVSAATEAARRGDINLNQHFLIATQWLVKVIK